MAHQDVVSTAQEDTALPVVRDLSLSDLKIALAKGFDDFAAMPSHAVFISLIYPIVGLFLGRLMFGYEVVPLLFPLAAGFALIGPFAAIGLYELSRQREQGREVSWRDALDIVHSPSFGAILTLGLFLTAIFLIWLAVARWIYILNFGYGSPNSITQFVQDVFTTRAGWNLIVAGNGVGFLFAVAALTLSVVSFPLLLDRPIGAAAAALTSVRVVLKNPVTMAAWGLIVVFGLVIGSLPLFFGLAVVMPVLGHATWHLYRRAVVPETDPHPQAPRPPKGPRYAAEFPAALFPWGREKEPPQ